MSQKYTNLSSLFTDIADAIREKKGTNEGIIADDFPDEISSIESGGDTTDLEANFIMQTINPEIFSHTTEIGACVFAYNSKLTSVNFPLATNIGNSAFYACASLTSVSFPQVTIIGADAFRNCDSLISVNFPKATNIKGNVFFHCDSLISVNFPQATAIGYEAFNSCFSLTSVSFPQVTNMRSYAFQRCSSLTSVNFPQATTIEPGVFEYCSLLTSIILGGQQSQSGIIYSEAFSKCYNLTDLYLQGSYLYRLSKSNAFYSTPIAGYSASAGKYGSIYVPASLYSRYISATNWTYFSSRFVSVSQSSGGNDSGGNNNNYGFTVNENTLTITDNSKLTDGINPDAYYNDYLIVGLSLDDDTYENLTDGISQTGMVSINPQYWNDLLLNNNINNEGLSVCLTDGNNTYQILLDYDNIYRIQLATIRDSSKVKRYIPVINKTNIYNTNEYNLNNNLNFYWVCHDYDKTSSCYNIIDFNLQENLSEFDFNDYWEINYITDISDDMFEYPSGGSN